MRITRPRIEERSLGARICEQIYVKSTLQVTQWNWQLPSVIIRWNFKFKQKIKLENLILNLKKYFEVKFFEMSVFSGFMFLE